MTAAWLWARADLRARWRSWVVLGLLAGATFGLAAAGVAGARRTSDAVPRFVSAARVPTAGVLANDPSYDEKQRAAVAALPEVRAAFPFLVAVALEVKPAGFDSRLIPTAASSVRPMVGVIVEGRMPDPTRPDEVVVDQSARRKFGLGLGATMVVGQSISPAEAATAPPGFVPKGVDLDFRIRLRVVGIAKSVSSDANWTPSFGFYEKYGPRLIGFVNQLVDLRHGDADLPRFRADVERVAGRPVNVESYGELIGLRKAANVTRLERNGLLLFALAVILGGGVLVGQALVRAVTAGAGDLQTWQAIGANKRSVIPALIVPAALSAATAAASAIVIALALSSRFPIGLARLYDLDVGTHADWPVLALGALAVVAAVVAIALLAAWWRTTRKESPVRSTSTASAWAARAGLPPALLVGSQLAVEPGRGRRAVPVRSALVGAVAGVLGVVACFTFRAGINDTIASPQRSGIVWDFEVGSGLGPVAPGDLAAIVHDRDVAAVIDAVWTRALRVNGTTTPAFGTTTEKGNISLVVLDGRAPSRPDEIAFAPATMRELHLHIGDRVLLGSEKDRAARVVGSALLPATSHTDYDQSAWMTAAGLRTRSPRSISSASMRSRTTCSCASRPARRSPPRSAGSAGSAPQTTPTNPRPPSSRPQLPISAGCARSPSRSECSSASWPAPRSPTRS